MSCCSSGVAQRREKTTPASGFNGKRPMGLFTAIPLGTFSMTATATVIEKGRSQRVRPANYIQHLLLDRISSGELLFKRCCPEKRKDNTGIGVQW
ncbi:MAG: hypothetical protein PVJ39_01150 [Gammaproteobacteria bacterium]